MHEFSPPRITLAREPSEYSERVVEELLSADAVFPEQFWGCRDGTIPLSGERALMWAVFADAVDCYRRFAHAKTAHGRAEFKEVRSWVLSTDWDWPFSFVNLCEAFGFDPGGVRLALDRWSTGRLRRAVRRQRFRPVTLHAA
jgi:hypothetical protein